MLDWGYNPGIPADVTVAWGCRAIVRQDGSVDVLGDRQGCMGGEAERKELLNYLNANVGMAWRERARDLLISYRMKVREGEEFVLFEDDEVIVVGNTLSSCGYLYVAAYMKEKEE